MSGGRGHKLTNEEVVRRLQPKGMTLIGDFNGMNHLSTFTCPLCSQEFDADGSYVLFDKTFKSCGCSRFNKKSFNWRGCGDVSGIIFNGYKKSAKSRKLSFNITIEDIWNLFLQQNKKCSISNLELSFPYHKDDVINKTASLDRIDSNKGYESNNIQWIHKDINFMKNNLSLNHFKYLCYLVINKLPATSNTKGLTFTDVRRKSYVGYKNLSGVYYRNKVISAKRRKILWDISIKQIWDLYEKQNGLCYYTNTPIFFRDYNRDIGEKSVGDWASIDRIDSSQGYVINNIVLSHKDINLIKYNFDTDTFYNYCKLISDNNKDK